MTTANPFRVITVTDHYPATQIVWPEGLTVQITNTDPNNNVYIGNHNAIEAGDITATVPLTPNGTYIAAGNVPVFAICKPGQKAAVVLTPDSVFFNAPGIAAAIGTALPSEDVSTPGVVQNLANAANLSVTTATFSPPSGSWLVAMVLVGGENTAVIAISDTGGHTWSKQVDVNATGAGTATFTLQIYRAFIATGSAITVTASNSSGNNASITLAVRVIINANATQTGAATGTTVFTTATTAIQQAITTTKQGSLVYLVAGSALSHQSISDTSTILDFGDNFGNSMVCGRSAANSGVPGSVTYGWTITSAENGCIGAMEIVP